LTIGWKIIGNR